MEISPVQQDEEIRVLNAANNSESPGNAGTGSSANTQFAAPPIHGNRGADCCKWFQVALIIIGVIGLVLGVAGALSLSETAACTITYTQAIAFTSVGSIFAIAGLIGLILLICTNYREVRT